MHERFNTQADVPGGTIADPANSRRITTLGVTYKPVWNVVFKGDYQLRRDRSNVDQPEVVSLGIGYQF